MKSQDDFVAVRKRDWDELDRLVSAQEGFHKLDGPTISKAAELYRSVCADVTRCRTAAYTSDLNAYLDGLAARAHRSLYGAPPFHMPDVLRLFARDFPVTLRSNARFFAVSCALLLVPCAIGVALGLLGPHAATRILPVAVLEGMADAYSKGFSGREGGTDTGMAGFYVYNNVGIAFRCFATGVFFGLGSVFFLIYNGLVIGTVAGYVMQAGYGGNILTFMCGHAPFEITAILISGAAGLRMGYALIDTCGMTRLGSLRRSAPEIARMGLVAAAMLVIAALVEGFWSPSSLPPPIKWTAAVLFTVAVAAYLLFAGRSWRVSGSQNSEHLAAGGTR